MVMFRYVLFDLDGTITDPEEGITRSAAYALDAFGIAYTQDKLRKIIGPPLDFSFRTFFGMTQEDALLAVSKYRERYETVGVTENKLIDGIAELLDELTSYGITVGLASSKPEIFCKRILADLGLLQYFSAVVGSELDGRRVAKNEVIAEAVLRLGNPPSDQIAMVGDRIYDLVGAKANGLYVIGVTYGFAEPGELNGADALASEPAALLPILLGNR